MGKRTTRDAGSLGKGTKDAKPRVETRHDRSLAMQGKKDMKRQRKHEQKRSIVKQLEKERAKQKRKGSQFEVTELFDMLRQSVESKTHIDHTPTWGHRGGRSQLANKTVQDVRTIGTLLKDTPNPMEVLQAHIAAKLAKDKAQPQPKGKGRGKGKGKGQ
ncbi:hypothetical protein KIPB_003183 [Kipferlia bialata]|uniref:Ribosome biogenesis protein SLX9 n=1 Tax=Kipferlia bialata TaxID=797122 RepID=A0A9K3CT10_9EUKA|nr:hypothetical protein KIPB_003183 [Kipferlia bialata]|eukprot:g3183.t1